MASSSTSIAIGHGNYVGRPSASAPNAENISVPTINRTVTAEHPRESRHAAWQRIRVLLSRLIICRSPAPEEQAKGSAPISLGISHSSIPDRQSLHSVSSKAASTYEILSGSSRQPAIGKENFFSAEIVEASLGFEGIENIAFSIRKNGLGHVLWGSKPAYWLESDENTYGCIKNLIGGDFCLKDKFILVPDGRGGGFLINKENLLPIIENHKKKFESLIDSGDEQSAKTILQKLILTPPDPHDPDVRNQTLLGTMLGYGLSNAENYARMHSVLVNDQERQHLADTILEEIELPRTAESQEDTPAIEIPKFVAWDSEETTRLHKQYAADAVKIENQLCYIEDDFDLNATTAFLNGISQKAGID